MASDPESLVKALLDDFKAIVHSETVIGKECKAGEYILIPISRISLGVGAGGGSGNSAAQPHKGEGGGCGGGLRIDPIAFVVVKGDDISFYGVKKAAVLEALLEKAPEMAEKLMSKVLDIKNQKDDKTKRDDAGKK